MPDVQEIHLSQLAGTSQIGRVASRRASAAVTPMSSSARRDRDRAKREKVVPIRENDRDRDMEGERLMVDIGVPFYSVMLQSVLMIYVDVYGRV